MSLTQTQLEAALSPDQPWKSAYAIVEQQARYYLDALLPQSPGYSTKDLANCVYSGDKPVVKARVYKALSVLSERSLARYITRGPEEKIGNRMGRRKLWGYPQAEVIPPAKPCCETCGRPL